LTDLPYLVIKDYLALASGDRLSSLWGMIDFFILSLGSSSFSSSGSDTESLPFTNMLYFALFTSLASFVRDFSEAADLSILNDPGCLSLDSEMA
jgi:hypothetical protein